MPKLDEYSDMMVSFDVAAWARGHKFNITAVKLSHELRVREQLIKERDRIQTMIDQSEEAIKKHQDDARVKMQDKV